LAKRIPIRERISVRILGEAFNVQNRVNYLGREYTLGHGHRAPLNSWPFSSRRQSAPDPARRQVRLL